MAKRIYGFICDEALQKWDSNALLVSNIDQGAGVATQNVIEYFNQVSVLKDSRGSRFTNYIGGGVTMYGKLGFIIDNTPPNNEGSLETAEDSGAIPGDVIDVSKIGSEELDKLFNILEDCLYARSTNSGDLVTSFLNVRFASSTTYRGYINGSIKISSDSAGVEQFINGITGRASDNSTIATRGLKLPQWIEFGFNTEFYGEVIFKLWLGRDHFLANYPLVTVTDVVLPCDAAYLAEPSRLGTTTGSTAQGTPLKTLIDSSTFMNNVYRNNFAVKESSGVYSFATSYFPESYTNVSMPFAVVYKGATPSLELVKKAIRNKLLSTGIDEETWIVAFPDLFTAAKFYLIPYWGNTFTSAGTRVESGICNWNTAYAKFKEVFPYYNQVELNARLELMLNDATNLIIAAIPDSGNDANKTMKRIHPTYVPVDAISGERLWTYQDDKTKAFNTQLTYAIADANAGSIGENHDSLSIIEVECGNGTTSIKRNFVFFSMYNCEYYILMRSAWESL